MKTFLKSYGARMKFSGSLSRLAGHNFVLTLLLAAVSLFCSFGLMAQENAGSQNEGVVPISGASWLNGLRVWFDDTCMGRTGRWGKDAGSYALVQSEGDSGLFTLTGADLYRLSCRPCHQPSGQGCGSEIRSLIELVRQTSPILVDREMEQKGRAISMESAKTRASQAESSLRDRLAHGGENMPSFGHFEADQEIALLNYLRQLAAVPERELTREVRVTQSAVQLGELLVRGTCHICHDATEIDAKYSYTRGGEKIPSLSSFSDTKSIQEAISKVRLGSPVPGGRRGRMPIFSYLSEKEVTAAYLYLAVRPTRP